MQSEGSRCTVDGHDDRLPAGTYICKHMNMERNIDRDPWSPSLSSNMGPVRQLPLNLYPTTSYGAWESGHSIWVGAR